MPSINPVCQDRGGDGEHQASNHQAERVRMSATEQKDRRYDDAKADRS